MDEQGSRTGDGAEPMLPAGHRGQAQSAWLRSWTWCEQAWTDFLNLILPSECVVCGRADHTLCPRCLFLLRRQTKTPYRAEGSADALVGVLGEPHLPVVAGGDYRDTLASVILAFKNHGRTELAVPLSRCLARALTVAVEQARAAAMADSPRVRDSPQSPDSPQSVSADVRQEPLWLVPIPSTGSGWRRRGYDPVALVLRALVRQGRLPPGVVIAPLLGTRAKLPWHRHHQKGLGRAARRRNIHNTMRLKGKLRPVFWLSANPAAFPIVLVDDVLTTGSTLREAAKTLESAGHQVLCAVVLAAARAPDPGQGNTAMT